mmetsp:Transcript_46552/g.134108  ORF Transcript_46552/g.134108 Transcript_46552/m.134108 type:complete len:119 (-) Transcript_46552:122-478(-)|eukprot:CAMPEP_0176078690 /NCGR_PEP_ID=MMETSP0120_2-20121206/39352_1 /TAXON_ID=160619 /ORGANISM="Kryptoperidinium foliaceum, Strain CCMP 1326" /LENGTH=118 /DNA_ID=CAMNT_0017412437 /DNA_START=66 /DNA_END=422 /DNA_ORIENTATION=-
MGQSAAHCCGADRLTAATPMSNAPMSPEGASDTEWRNDEISDHREAVQLPRVRETTHGSQLNVETLEDYRAKRNSQGGLLMLLQDIAAADGYEMHLDRRRPRRRSAMIPTPAAAAGGA